MELKEYGNKAYSLGNYQEAVNWYSLAVEASPSSHVLYSNRSAALIALGKYDLALQDSNLAISLSPAWPRGYYRKYRALCCLNQYKAAREALRIGLKHNPTNAQLRQELATVDKIIVDLDTSKPPEAASKGAGVEASPLLRQNLNPFETVQNQENAAPYITIHVVLSNASASVQQASSEKPESPSSVSQPGKESYVRSTKRRKITPSSQTANPIVDVLEQLYSTKGIEDIILASVQGCYDDQGRPIPVAPPFTASVNRSSPLSVLCQRLQERAYYTIYGCEHEQVQCLSTNYKDRLGELSRQLKKYSDLSEKKAFMREVDVQGLPFRADLQRLKELYGSCAALDAATLSLRAVFALQVSLHVAYSNRSKSDADGDPRPIAVALVVDRAQWNIMRRLVEDEHFKFPMVAPIKLVAYEPK